MALGGGVVIHILVTGVFMKVNELIEQINKNNPALLKGMPEKTVIALIRTILTSVGDAVDSVDDGDIAVAILGRFRVKQKEREVDGKKIVAKHIVFRRASPRKKNESGDSD